MRASRRPLPFRPWLLLVLAPLLLLARPVSGTAGSADTGKDRSFAELAAARARETLADASRYPHPFELVLDPAFAPRDREFAERSFDALAEILGPFRLSSLRVVLTNGPGGVGGVDSRPPDGMRNSEFFEYCHGPYGCTVWVGKSVSVGGERLLRYGHDPVTGAPFELPHVTLTVSAQDGVEATAVIEAAVVEAAAALLRFPEGEMCWGTRSVAWPLGFVALETAAAAQRRAGFEYEQTRRSRTEAVTGQGWCVEVNSLAAGLLAGEFLLAGSSVHELLAFADRSRSIGAGPALLETFGAEVLAAVTRHSAG